MTTAPVNSMPTPRTPERSPAGSAPASGLRRAWSAVRLWGRMVRSQPMLVFAVAAMVVLGAILAASGARLLHRVSTDDLRQSIGEGDASDRTLSQVYETRIGPGPAEDPLRQIDDRGQRFLDQAVPEEVAEVLGPRQFVFDSPPYRVGSFPDQDDGPFTLSFRFRYQQGVADHLTLVEGAMPTERDPIKLLFGPDCPPDRLAVEGYESDDETDCKALDVPVHEVAVTATTAEDLLLELGDRAILRPDIVDPAWAFAFDRLLSERLVLEISGIIELSDPDDDYWFDDSALHRPSITENPDFRFVYATGLLDPGSYRRLIRNVLEVDYVYTWRHPVVAERIDTDGAEALMIEFEKLETAEGDVITGVPQVIADHLDQRDLTIALLSVAFAGVAVLASAAAWVLTTLTVARQENTWRLVLARGFGRPMVVGIGLVHGIVVAVPAGLVGLAAGAALVPDSPPRDSMILVALLSTAVILATTAATATAVLGRKATAGQSTARAGSTIRPLVRDGVVVILACAAAILIQGRDGSGGIDAGGDLDILLAIAPGLIGGGFAVVLLRLTGPLFGLLAAGATRLPGTVPHLGFRRLTADDRAARSSMVVLVLAVGLAGMAWSVRTSVAAARFEEGWHAIGADLEVRAQTDAAPLSSDVVARVDELGADHAFGAVFPGAAFRPELDPSLDEDSASTTSPVERQTIDLVAIESAATARVLDPAPLPAGVAAAIEGLRREPIDPTSTPAESASIAAVVVGSWPGEQELAIGDRLVGIVDGSEVIVEVVAAVDLFPGLAPNRASLVVDLDRLATARGAPSAPTMVRLLAPTQTDEELQAWLEPIAPESRIRSRTGLAAAVADDPLAVWALRGLVAMTGYALLLAVAATAAGLGLTAPTRQRDIALLSTLGLRRGQRRLIVAIEHLMPLVLAGVTGFGLALGLIVVLSEAMNLVPFVVPPPEIVGPAFAAGSTDSASTDIAGLTPDWRGLAVGLAILFGVLSLMVVAVERLDRRHVQRAIVRSGGES